MGDRGAKETIFCVRRILPLVMVVTGWQEGMMGSQERKAQRVEGRGNSEGWESGWPVVGVGGVNVPDIPEAGAETVMLILDAWGAVRHCLCASWAEAPSGSRMGVKTLDQGSRLCPERNI